MSEEAYIEFVTGHAGDDPGRLLLSADRWPEIDVRRAARNIAARARIRTKIPSWYAHPELEYPGSLPLEQASSEATALYKQAFVPDGARFADLTGGLGVDCWFMSQRASEAHYCEQNPELCAAASHNFAVLENSPVSEDSAQESAAARHNFAALEGLAICEDCSQEPGCATPPGSSVASFDGSHPVGQTAAHSHCGESDPILQPCSSATEYTDIAVHEGDGIEWLRQQDGQFDLIYLDPARRDNAARRVYDISDCEPNLLEVKELLLSKGRRVLAKISPMADISRTLEQFPEARELHVVAVAGEVKELLLLLEAPGGNAKLPYDASPAAPHPEPLIVAHDIPHITAGHPNPQHPQQPQQPQRTESPQQTQQPQRTQPPRQTQHPRQAQPTLRTQPPRQSACEEAPAPHHFEFRPSEEPEAEVQYACRIGKYLFQPSKAVLKAGAFRLLSRRYNLEKLAPSTHLYTADNTPEGFPGKVFEVESVMEWSKSSIRQIKQQYESLEMTALNFPLATDALRQRLGIKAGGTHHLFATTLADKSKILIITCG